MIGALIGAGTSLLGGLFGRKKQKTESSVDYVKMARSAEAAGFNPLTAIRNGGSAGFATTVHHPGLSGVGDAISQIGGTLGQALSKKYDPIEQKRDEVERALLDYQLGAIQQGNQPLPRFGGVPVRRATGVSRVSQPGLASSGKNAPGEGTLVGGDDPTVSSMGWNDGKYGLFHAPAVPDADTFEQIYGENEIMSTLYGAGKLALGDIPYSIWRNAKSAYGDYIVKPTKAKRDPKYEKEYWRNIRESVPSLANPPKTTW